MIGEGHNYLFAYIFDVDGRYPPGIKMPIDTVQIASFIKRTENAPRVLFTNLSDYPEIEIFNGFIHYCEDQSFLEQLKLDLIPMQEGTNQPQEVTPISWNIEGSEERIKNWINERFKTNL